VGEHLVLITGDPVRSQTGLLQVVVQQQARPGTFLAIDEPDPVSRQILESANPKRIALGKKKAHLPVKEIDNHRFDARNPLRQVGDVVLPAFGIQQVRPGNVGKTLLQRQKPSPAPRVRGKDEQFGMSLFQAGLENVEQRIVAPGREERPGDPFALPAGLLQT